MTFDRPPLERYVRATVEANGYTIEPAIEFRDGDHFDEWHETLALMGHDAARLAGKPRCPDGLHTGKECATVPTLADPMAMATAIGEQIAQLWPDRAYFVEVWQVGGAGFAQVFQPFGVPRNHAVSQEQAEAEKELGRPLTEGESRYLRSVVESRGKVFVR